MARWKIALLGAAALIGGGILYIVQVTELDLYVPLFAQHCAECHGSDLRGTETGIALIDATLTGGDSVGELIDSINRGNPSAGMPAFKGVLTDDEIKGLAIFVGEKRMGQRFTEFQFDRSLEIPSDIQQSEEHAFRIETVVENLDPLIFSIEPMPDGAWLVSQKEKGLIIVSPDGSRSEPIAGTPETGGSLDIMGVQYGVGWLLDVALHPDYENNGWIYLHHTHLCGEACGDGVIPSSMNRLERGKIIDGRWVDVEVIWQAPTEFYNPSPDTGAGGRIAFDDTGHVFISTGIKHPNEGDETDTSPQDLDCPYGKIHRINDDGTIPADNPFVVSSEPGDSAVRQSIWTYGHRSPQGLERNPIRRSVWNSEMGPRGGDELNELKPGRNYGWPYHSLGMEYTGRPVERYKLKDVEFDTDTVEKTLVDITPSPAISSFIFYDGRRFEGWKDNVLIGSLKGSDLFRMVFDGDQLVHRETLITDLARIRDVEEGNDGLIYLLLENEAGSAIVRLVPADVPQAAAL